MCDVTVTLCAQYINVFERTHAHSEIEKRGKGDMNVIARYTNLATRCFVYQYYTLRVCCERMLKKVKIFHVLFIFSLAR